MIRPSPSVAALLALLAGTTLLAACGGGSGSTPAAGPPPAVVERTPARPVASTNIAIEPKDGGRVWVVNQDNDSVSVIDPASRTRLAEIAVGAAPRTLAIGRDGQVWVASRDDGSLSRIDPQTLAVTGIFRMPAASQPFGVIESPADGDLWVSLQARGEVVRVDPGSGAILARIAIGESARHLSMPATGERLYVSRFITPPVPGESTSTPDAEAGGQSYGGQIVTVDPVTGQTRGTIVLQASRRSDTSTSGRGIPNYVGAMAIAPDGLTGWVPSKQDNIFRGSGRRNPYTGAADGPLTFETTVRAISSKVLLDGTPVEDLAMRVDHDNASLASAATFDPQGRYLIVALETSQEIALLHATFDTEVTMRGGARVRTGRAPQGVAISADGMTLAVNNFMDRTVGLYDLGALTTFFPAEITPLGEVATITTEALDPDVLRGKQLFYDAFDERLARDRYMSCASCHNDGDHDGRTWDFTSFDGVTAAEGLRNTISLRGRAGGGALLHWSGNFDEVQDFEGQIRTFAGGTGLMADDDFNAGSRGHPLGDPKAGISTDLDALAAYVQSLNTHALSPWRNDDGTLTATAAAGKSVFAAKCASCHGGPEFAAPDPRPEDRRRDIGTIRPTSGTRLGQSLTAIDVPPLRDLWHTAPYLHDGSAPTLGDAIDRHDTSALPAGAPNPAERAALIEYLKQIGSQEAEG